MDAVLLTWRWQNILSIWIMIIALALLVMFGFKAMNIASGGSNEP